MASKLVIIGYNGLTILIVTGIVILRKYNYPEPIHNLNPNLYNSSKLLDTITLLGYNVRIGWLVSVVRTTTLTNRVIELRVHG